MDANREIEVLNVIFWNDPDLGVDWAMSKFNFDGFVTLSPFCYPLSTPTKWEKATIVRWSTESTRRKERKTTIRENRVSTFRINN